MGFFLTLRAVPASDRQKESLADLQKEYHTDTAADTFLHSPKSLEVMFFEPENTLWGGGGSPQ